MDRDARIIFLIVTILIMAGIVMIYSSSAIYAHNKFGDSLYFIKRHLFHLGLGLACALFCMLQPVQKIRHSAGFVMIFFMILLGIVLVPELGRQIGGARRWFRIFNFGFQPSELAKIALVLYLADAAARKRFLLRNFKYGFLPPVLVISLTALLILIEPDMGTAVAVFFIGFVMLFTFGVRLRHILTVALGTLPVLCLAVMAEPYRIKRILAFVDPWADARGTGFQLIQSFVALGSGGFWGIGLGLSKQKLFYLPESHTDFIFSIIGEEAGFLGAGIILLLFAALVWFIMRISIKLKDTFASGVVLGIGVMIAFEAIVNIGVSVGLFPTKGLPLPFISYGGSSIISHLVGIGLVFNMSRMVE